MQQILEQTFFTHNLSGEMLAVINQENRDGVIFITYCTAEENKTVCLEEFKKIIAEEIPCH